MLSRYDLPLNVERAEMQRLPIRLPTAAPQNSSLLRHLQLFALFLEHGFAAQLDFVAFERQHLHQDLVAFFQLVANVAYAVLRDLADMQQAVRPREDLDDRSQIN